MNWTEIVTAVVAVYGAALGTYNLIVRVRERHPRIKVRISMGFLGYAIGGTSETMIFLEATNPGRTTITLNPPFFRLPNRQQIVFPNPQSNVSFPYELLPGKNCQIWVEAKEFARTLQESGYSRKVKLIGLCRDQVGTLYKSKSFKFNISNWTKA